MTKKMAVHEVLEKLRTDPSFSNNVIHTKTIAGKEAIYAEFPEKLHPSIIKALASKGINKLYSHQREAYDLATSGNSFTAVTPTASAKSLCYHLPVMQSILEDDTARAIYLFPNMKALAPGSAAENL